MIIKLKRFISKWIQNYLNKKLIFAIEPLLGGQNSIGLLDLGAAGDIEPRWKKISKYLNYYAVEPDNRSNATLTNQHSCNGYQIIPCAIWGSSAEKQLEVNLCKDPQVSSFYEPNFEFLNNFPNVERFQVVNQIPVKVNTLDEMKLINVDFIKLDIQGAELQALKGGGELLKNILGAEIEVEFSELYLGQPLFGEVCSIMTQNSFEFIDFTNLCRWERESLNGHGQCVFGDALFLVSPETLIGRNPDDITLKKYMCICLIYNRFDLISKVINLYTLDNDSIKSFSKRIKLHFYINQGIRIACRFFSALISLFGPEYRSHLIK